MIDAHSDNEKDGDAVQGAGSVIVIPFRGNLGLKLKRTRMGIVIVTVNKKVRRHVDDLLWKSAERTLEISKMDLVSKRKRKAFGEVEGVAAGGGHDLQYSRGLAQKKDDFDGD